MKRNLLRQSLNRSISMRILTMTAVPQRHTLRRIIHGPRNINGPFFLVLNRISALSHVIQDQVMHIV